LTNGRNLDGTASTAVLVAFRGQLDHGALDVRLQGGPQLVGQVAPAKLCDQPQVAGKLLRDSNCQRSHVFQRKRRIGGFGGSGREG
jgi:hypothetical protein